MCLAEKILVFDKLHSGLSYGAVDEPGAGARECVAGEPYSAKCCIRRSVSNAPYPGNSCLAGARQRCQHPPPHLQLLLAFSEGSPRTTENCLLLRQQVAHTSSGLSFEKTDCEGSPRLGRPYFQVGALATVEEADTQRHISKL
uniref:Uncharacterized protein n=1 Tax=Rousettus aegyptiacus TaxID=9407 RepID=A0A7J8H222_ROUAE|nr:hypothetical protein HJG63_011333 [Rousettus aegyptiacus]